MGKSVDAPVEPEYGKTLRKDTERTALGLSKLNPKQLAIYEKAIKMKDPRALKMLARKNMTQHQALKGITEHRAKLQSVGRDSKALNSIDGVYPRERLIMHNRIARGIIV